MKDIKGYEGLYAITSCGKVWSYRSQKFLKPVSDKDGYWKINLSKDGQRKTYQVHRLVAQAYIPNPEDKPQVNHKDEVKTHNYINNLEWTTAKENSNHGTRTKRSVETQRKNKTNMIPVYCIELDRVFDGVNVAAAELGLSGSNLCACLQGRQKTFGGYHWRYYYE